MYKLHCQVLRTRATVDVREAAAAELWIWGGFLCFLQVLPQQFPPNLPFLAGQDMPSRLLRWHSGRASEAFPL